MPLVIVYLNVPFQVTVIGVKVILIEKIVMLKNVDLYIIM
jgi:hypothetical protein